MDVFLSLINKFLKMFQPLPETFLISGFGAQGFQGPSQGLIAECDYTLIPMAFGSPARGAKHRWLPAAVTQRSRPPPHTGPEPGSQGTGERSASLPAPWAPKVGWSLHTAQE